MIGADVYTIHSHPSGLCNDTVGIYAMSDAGWSGGLLRNSECNPGGWFGYSRESNTLVVAGTKVTAALTVGVIAGYRASPVLPMLVPSIKVGSVRFSYLPRSPGAQTDGIHISIEFEQDKPALAGFFTPINK